MHYFELVNVHVEVTVCSSRLHAVLPSVVLYDTTIQLVDRVCDVGVVIAVTNQSHCQCLRLLSSLVTSHQTLFH